MNIVKAHADHIPMFIAALSDADKLEMSHMGQSPEETARHTLSISSSAFSWIENGVPVLMFGVMEPQVLLLGFGTIWMMATTELKKHMRAFVKAYPYWLKRLSEGYSSVECQVHRSLRTTLRVIQHAGFKVVDERPFAQSGNLFKHCVKEV